MAADDYIADVAQVDFQGAGAQQFERRRRLH